MNLSPTVQSIIDGSNQDIKNMLIAIRGLPIVIHDEQETLAQTIKHKVRWGEITSPSEIYELYNYMQINRVSFRDIAAKYL